MTKLCSLDPVGRRVILLTEFLMRKQIKTPPCQLILEFAMTRRPHFWQGRRQIVPPQGAQVGTFAKKYRLGFILTSKAERITKLIKGSKSYSWRPNETHYFGKTIRFLVLRNHNESLLLSWTQAKPEGFFKKNKKYLQISLFFFSSASGRFLFVSQHFAFFFLFLERNILNKFCFWNPNRVLGSPDCLRMRSMKPRPLSEKNQGFTSVLNSLFLQ